MWCVGGCLGQDGGGSAQITPTDEEWRWGLSLLKKIKTLVPKEGVYWSAFASIILCNKQPQHSLACLNNKWVLVGWVHVCFMFFSFWDPSWRNGLNMGHVDFWKGRSSREVSGDTWSLSKPLLGTSTPSCQLTTQWGKQVIWPRLKSMGQGEGKGGEKGEFWTNNIIYHKRKWMLGVQKQQISLFPHNLTFHNV